MVQNISTEDTMSSHPVDLHVGKRLRLRRSMLGMSQEELGKNIGVTFQQVQKYERGVNRIGSGRLYDLSNILSVPINFFFEEMNAAADGSSANAGMAESRENFEHQKLSSKETLSLVRAYYKISDDKVRKKVLELIKSMAAKNNEDKVA